MGNVTVCIVRSARMVVRAVPAGNFETGGNVVLQAGAWFDI
jgi:hypothetical protein